MIVTQNKTTTLYSYQNGIGANTEAILNRTLRHILYGDLYDGGEAASLILTATAFKDRVEGDTLSVANVNVVVDESMTANMKWDGSQISGKAEPNATITIEVNT